jgi:hypothetical protein
MLSQTFSFRFPLLTMLCLCLLFRGQAQHSDRGIDLSVADDMFSVNSIFFDSVKTIDRSSYQLLYKSQSMGMDNAWALSLKDDSTVIIALRGTTADTKSLLADFYCAMIPAKGSITLDGKGTLEYKLAEDPRAAVHAGFLLGFAYLSKDMLPRIDSLYQSGYRNYIVAGHSQGGALCYYVSAWLLYKVRSGHFKDMSVKTYASASPKVGNMYFAYDYDHLTRNNPTYSIVNALDIVPEMPFTTQQLEEDMNHPNPFINPRFKNLPGLQRWFLKRALKRMRKAAVKSARMYQRYLGGYTSSVTAKLLPGTELPSPVKSVYYVRPGIPVSLVPDDSFFKEFEKQLSVSSYFNHDFSAYRFLLKKY